MNHYPLHPNAVPLYTTVETEWLDELMKGRDLLYSLTIKREHLKLIKDSLVKARTKHPKFCDRIVENENLERAEMIEALLKKNNDNATEYSAENLLLEELAEMCTQALKGEKEKAKEECADCIAILVRTMEELDK